MGQKTGKWELKFSKPSDEVLVMHLSGDWCIENDLPSANDVERQIERGPQLQRIAFDTKDLHDWDSGFLTYLVHLIKQSSIRNIGVDRKGLPEGVQRLLSLASAVPERTGVRRETAQTALLERFGESAISFWRMNLEMIEFVGEVFVAFLKMLAGKAQFRRADLFLIIQESGAEALPIVSLISLLVGLILAFIGALQLKMFGAEIYVASVVGIGMTRVMAAVMTGVIMAGRTGASFAAQLGTMQENEEIDALITLGISPMEFLVLPRVLALSLMMPLLCLYADLISMVGGFIVGVAVLNLNFTEYYNQTQQAVTLQDVWIGLFSSAIFGVLVALAGCLRGMQSGRSASAVGEAATSAVVSSIVSITVATAIITVVCNVLGI
jgi:phospholipid/cholesterol/gamma-HCH transport system permease protein